MLCIGSVEHSSNSGKLNNGSVEHSSNSGNLCNSYGEHSSNSGKLSNDSREHCSDSVELDSSSGAQSGFLIVIVGRSGAHMDGAGTFLRGYSNLFFSSCRFGTHPDLGHHFCKCVVFQFGIVGLLVKDFSNSADLG